MKEMKLLKIKNNQNSKLWFYNPLYRIWIKEKRIKLLDKKLYKITKIQFSIQNNQTNNYFNNWKFLEKKNNRLYHQIIY